MTHLTQDDAGRTPALPTEHFFTQKERDCDTVNDYFLARYYTSALGRFMSPDPGPYLVPNPQSWNRYTYGWNNPLGNTDPTGRVVNVGGESAQQFIDLLKKRSGLNLVTDKKGHLKAEGKRDKNGTNGELAKQINRAINSDSRSIARSTPTRLSTSPQTKVKRPQTTFTTTTPHRRSICRISQRQMLRLPIWRRPFWIM
jgi:RHS repeat-associated protein